MVNPGDTVVVSRAGIVYILGDVNRPGGYVMSNNESQLTLLQGLALAGSATRGAKQGHAHLIRQKPGGGYTDTEFSIGDIQKGKQPDIALLPGDVALPAVLLCTQLRDDRRRWYNRRGSAGGCVHDPLTPSSKQTKLTASNIFPTASEAKFDPHLGVERGINHR